MTTALDETDDDNDGDLMTTENTTSSGRRRWLIWTMIVLASVISVAAGLNAWAQRQLLDTDEWVKVSDDLLADDDVRGALSAFLIDELYTNIDVSGEIENQLPDDFKGLAGPVSAALRGPATEAVDRLLDSNQVRQLWSTVNRTAHESLVNVLRDETRDGVSVSGGTVALELGEVVRSLGDQLGLPESVLDKLPEDAGQIVIVESDELDAVQSIVKIVELMSIFLFILVVALYAGAVYLSTDRRETLRNVGWSITISGVALAVIRRITQQFAVDELNAAPDTEAAVHAVMRIATTLLNQVAMTGIIVGLMIAAYAILVGPSRSAVATRKALAPLLSNTIAIWMTALAFILILAALFPEVSIRSGLPRLVLLALFVAGVELLRRRSRREHPDASLDEQWDSVRGRASKFWSRTTSGSQSTPSSRTSEIEALHRLHQEGALTDEEFSEAKKSALSDP